MAGFINKECYQNNNTSTCKQKPANNQFTHHSLFINHSMVNDKVAIATNIIMLAISATKKIGSNKCGALFHRTEVIPAKNASNAVNINFVKPINWQTRSFVIHCYKT